MHPLRHRLSLATLTLAIATGYTASALLPLVAPIAHAQPAPVVWQMATEYPATSMPGEGLTTFAQEVTTRTQGTLAPQPTFDASAGIKSAQMPAAIRNGKLQAGDAFGGALGEVDPIFLLSSLPFVATSVDKAHRLADLARADYAQAFEKQGQHLLYITPWPPTGLWTRKPVGTLDDLRSLSVRAYDETSADVMRAAGAKAQNLSFADAMPRLKDGSVNAVLSSGDGGAGRKLWDYLPHFTAIGYAMPLSFTTVNAAAWQSLTSAQRDAVTAAAKATEDKQWSRLNTRLTENTARMRTNGVTIDDNPAPAVQQALQAAGLSAVGVWQTRVGERGAALLKTYFSAEAGLR
ncbi:TRAP transporter substrate-binding protein [Cupriavidus metallidurans]|uniref:TRAP transporter substrate-binding protein n=1 Tax=Cupriavidus TaxID=106589 RepID=UPI0002A32F9D|nr:MULTISPECIES: TRAP transporter substrate-binding protein [unclassified Cupriavidus]ELA01145.1 C4-dicarboxylate ABC transporter substrate-binding protein [Cupriavidus sp. HMR-1]GMG93928.1 C4-dicarboxylate ABC transporter substrate-binding protein [Cupriavidus sp. TKC]HBD34703.1 signal peptidase [Cupriavidus sp.]HBO78966.1 signal peptidase [Cupriavidus sp.]